MESLIAAYAASDEEGDERPQASSSSKAQPSKQPGGGLFSSLPPPKNATAEPSKQPGGGLFSSLPPPKNTKKLNKVVEFRPPVDLSSLEEDEQEEKAKKRKRNQETGGGSVGDGLVLPAPRNSSGLGSGAVLGGGRRLAIEEEGVGVESTTEAAQAYYSYEGSTEGVQSTTEAAQAYYSYDGSTERVYGEPGPVYGDPGQVYGDAGQVYGNPLVYQQQEEEIVDPVAKADMRRDRREAVNFVQIKQSDLTANRPREDQMRVTGIAFGSMFDKSTSPAEKPSKMHKKKHQIGSLLYDMKEKEMELAERRARGFLNKSQTHAKYGW